MRHCLALFAFLSLAACATDSPQHREPIVRDSMGIRIVENSAPQWQQGQAWRLNPQPLVDIGGGDTEEDQLFRVLAAVRLTDGRIA